MSNIKFACMVSITMLAYPDIDESIRIACVAEYSTGPGHKATIFYTVQQVGKGLIRKVTKATDSHNPYKVTTWNAWEPFPYVMRVLGYDPDK